MAKKIIKETKYSQILCKGKVADEDYTILLKRYLLKL